MQIVAKDKGQKESKNSAKTQKRVRRCFQSGVSEDPARMVRFVVGPENQIHPDIRESLGGRGLWLLARRDIMNQACARDGFSRAARAKVKVAVDQADQVEALLRARCLDLIGLAKRAGNLVAGYGKVREWLQSGQAGLILEACDGARNGQQKMRGLARGLPVIDLFSGAEMGAALGRPHLVHVALAKGNLARELQRETGRLVGLMEPGQGSRAA